MRLNDKGLFVALLAMVAVCAFADDGLSGGVATAVAEEAEDTATAQESGTESTESAEDDSEATEAQENASEGESESSYGGPAGDTE